LIFLCSSFALIIVLFIPGHFITERFLQNTGQPVSDGTRVVFFLGKCFGELIIITGAAVIIKTMKDYSLKQKEHERLVAENISNKLQLLKMRIHPHILFECLQNVYRDLEEGNKHAPDMILKLSELLSYLLYEGQLNQVSIEKEIQMIQNYIELKKLEYKNKLDVRFELLTRNGPFDIAPGLFLPLLEMTIFPCENTEKTLCISVKLEILSSGLRFILKNNIAGKKIIAGNAASLVLENTKNKLQIYYPGRHKLQVSGKPISFERFLKAVNKVIKLNLMTGNKEITTGLTGQENDNGFIYLREDRRNIKIYLCDLLFIESLKNYIKVVTKDKTFVSKYSISALEGSLPSNFMRIHRSFIISKDKIEAFTHDYVKIGKYELPVSRSYRQGVEKNLKIE
jgi:hypothetical protein